MTQEDLKTRDGYILEQWRTGEYTVQQLAAKENLSHQRIRQILKKFGVKVERKLSGRRCYLGTTVTEETSRAVKEEAVRLGLSTSQHLSNIITNAVKKSNATPPVTSTGTNTDSL